MTVESTPAHRWVFLIWAFPYTHRSSGIRALYRLCHHLNGRGFPAALVTDPGEPLPSWNCFLRPVDHAVADVPRAIVVYPEVVSGNPLQADKVVRWVLNSPGLIGGDPVYPEPELVFVYDLQRLPEVNRAVTEPIGPERRLWTGLVDPSVIHPDASVPRDIDCSFTYKGAELAQHIPLPHGEIHPLESLTHDLASLGHTLRRTRTLYSYDHYSNVLREAVVSGCDVRVPDESGRWHDPRSCDCERNIHWHPDIENAYVDHFHSSDFVMDFVDQVRTRWDVPAPDRGWSRRLPFEPTTGRPRRDRGLVGRLRRRLRQRGGRPAGRG